MKQKIVFFGSGAYTIPIIEVLKKFDLVLIVTTDADEETGRYKSEFKKYLAQFPAIARNEAIPSEFGTTSVLVSDLKSDKDIDILKELEPTIGVLASYGAILPQGIIDLFPNGILNIHPSLLPKYKGPSPIQTTILGNDLASGVTVIKLDNEVDHGPIVEQGTVQLKGTETTQDLKNFLFAQGAVLIEKILKELEAGEPLITHAQDHKRQVFTKKITREDGEINVAAPPDPGTLDRMIRAYYPWPGVWLVLNDSEGFPSSNGEGLQKSPLFGKRIKLLPGQKIQVEGKNPMTYKDFMNGYPQGKKIIEKLTKE